MGLAISGAGMSSALFQMQVAAAGISTALDPSQADVASSTISSSSSQGSSQATSPTGPGADSILNNSVSPFSDSLVSNMVNLKLAQNSFEANVAAAKVANETLGSVIDMVNPQSTG